MLFDYFGRLKKMLFSPMIDRTKVKKKLLNGIVIRYQLILSLKQFNYHSSCYFSCYLFNARVVITVSRLRFYLFQYFLNAFVMEF